MRAELLSLYSDLVTPAFVASAVHEQPELPKGIIGALSRITRRRSRKPSMMSLVLARAKYIDEHHDAIIQALEQGEDTIEEDVQPVEQTTRRVGKHDVVGHRRKLASHQRASPQARTLAWEQLGIELAERGETFIQKHSRGSGEIDTLGHRADLRRPSAAREQGTINE